MPAVFISTAAAGNDAAITITAGDNTTVAVENGAATQVPLGNKPVTINATGNETATIMLEGTSLDTINATDSKSNVVLLNNTAVNTLTAGGNFTVGTKGATSPAKVNVGTLTINQDATATVEKGNLTSKDLTVNGTATVFDGDVTTKSTTLGDGSHLTVSGTLTSINDKTEDGKVKSSFEATGKGTVIVKSVTPGTQPVLRADVGELQATEFMTDGDFESLDNKPVSPAVLNLNVVPTGDTRTLTGKVLGAQNSIQYIGDGSSMPLSEALPEGYTIAKSGDKTVGAVTVVTAPLTIDPDKGAITVDALQHLSAEDQVSEHYKNVKPGELNVLNRGLLVLDINKQVNPTTPLVTAKAIDLQSTGYVRLLNVKPNVEYRVLTATDGALSKANIASTVLPTNSMLTPSLDIDTDTKTVVIKSEIKPVDEAFGKGAVINSAGISEYLSKVLPEKQKAAATAAQQAGKTAPNLFDTPLVNLVVAAGDGTGTPSAINDAQQAPTVVGVQGNTLAAHTILTDAVYHNATNTDKRIWATYVHQNRSVEDVDLVGGTSVMRGHSQFDAAVVGADLSKKDNHTVGVAASYVKGKDTNSETAATYGKDKDDYYGLAVYDRYKVGNLDLLGDLSYTHGSHKLAFTTLGIGYGDNISSNALSLGLRAQKSVVMADGNMATPYAGLRYTHIGTGDFTLGDLTVKTKGQNVLTMPIGIKFTAMKERGAWKIYPSADLSYKFFLAGRDATSTSVLAGKEADAKSTVLPQGLFAGNVGLAMTNGDTKYTVQYEYERGSGQNSHEFTANASFKF